MRNQLIAAAWLIAICVLLAACLFCGGCAGFDVSRTEYKPDGTRIVYRATGATCLAKRAIGKANIPGLGSIEHTETDSNADAIRAATEGATAGAVKAIKP